MRALATMALACATILAAGTAGAQPFVARPGAHVSRLDVEVHGNFSPGFYRGSDFGEAWGAGVRVNIPVWRNGPIPGLNNSLALSLGADVMVWTSWPQHDSTATEAVLPATMQWNFYLLPNVSAFGEAGLAVGTGGACCGIAVWPGLAVGARWHFAGVANYPALLVRVGFPVGLSVGMVF